MSLQLKLKKIFLDKLGYESVSEAHIHISQYIYDSYVTAEWHSYTCANSALATSFESRCSCKYFIEILWL